MDSFLRAARCAAFAGLALCCVPAPVGAQEFTSHEFLTWTRSQQDYYFRTSIGMAGLIASRNDDAQGRCVDEWFFENQLEAGDQILDTMRQHPQYHPRGVILAFVEKRCGSLVYR